MTHTLRCAATDGSPQGQSLQDLPADEAHFLTLARHFFHAIAVPGSESWMTAFVHAEMSLGTCGGARLAYGVLAAVQSLRTVRLLPFRYMQAGCKGCAARLTEDERHFVQAYRALRDGDPTQAQRHLTILTFSDETASLAAILSMLGQDFAPLAANPRR